MRRGGRYLSSWVLLLLFFCIGVGCSTRKNTGANRFYHRLTTRYNVYFNGQNHFNESYSGLIENYMESYSEPIFLDPIEAQRGVFKTSVGGSFDKALEKGQKAIKMHSIRVKPERKRNASAREDAFYRRKEYNTFLHNAWLLVGKSQFYNGDFMDAMATFSYMSRLYASEPLIRDEARLWQARSYVAMDWIHEGEALVNSLQSNNSLQRKSSIYDKTQAEIALAQGRTQDAIAPLQRAIRKEPNQRERLRMRYLLGQLQMATNQTKEAKRTFSALLRKAPPFPMEIAANLRIVELEARANPRSALRSTEKLARRSRNKDVLDRIYLTQGALYLMLPDTLKAIESFRLGGEKSTEHGVDYALCQIALGRLYRAQRQWTRAQEAYASGIASLPQNHPDYEASAELSKQLDALVIHARAVQEQDSLRYLAAQPEEVRFKIIDSVIVAYKKAEAERKRREQLNDQAERQSEANEEMGGLNPQQGITPTPAGAATSGEFYFYNPQLITQGKAKFVQKWGQRPLEDNWRRRRKQIALTEGGTDANEAAPRDATNVAQDSIPEGTETVEEGTAPSAAEDPAQREYYLAQLPLTEEQIAASDVIIQNGLRGMGRVFEEEMALYEEAIIVLEDVLHRYPQYKERLEVYYSLYMLCERLGNHTKALEWQRMITSQFPEDPLAKAVSDPQYIQKLRAADSLMNGLYDRTWQAYLQGEAATVRRGAKQMHEEFPLSELLPKVDYLYALSYVLENNPEEFKEALKKLVEQYPSADVTDPAQAMLADLLSGRAIAQGGYTGMQYDGVFGGEGEAVAADSLQFRVPLLADKHSVLLLYPATGVDHNALLFAVATFNFSQFTELLLSLNLERTPAVHRLTLSGFRGERSAWEYIRTAFSPQGYMGHLPEDALLLAISEYNLTQLQGGLSLDAYFDFLADSIAPRNSSVALSLNRYAALKERAEEKVAQHSTEEEHPQTEEVEQPVAPNQLPQESAESRPQESTPTTGAETSIEQSGEEQSQEQQPNVRFVTSNEPITYDDVQRLEKERRAREKAEAEEKKKQQRAAEEARRQLLRDREKQRQEERRKRAAAEKERRDKAQERERAQRKKRK